MILNFLKNFVIERVMTQLRIITLVILNKEKYNNKTFLASLLRIKTIDIELILAHLTDIKLRRRT